MIRIVTFFGRLAISTDSGSFSGQDCTVDPWSRDQWEEVSMWGHVLGKRGSYPTPLACTTFSSPSAGLAHPERPSLQGQGRKQPQLTCQCPESNAAPAASSHSGMLAL